MKRFSPLKITALLVVFAHLAFCAHAEDLKKIHPTGYVTDLAGTIAAGTKSRLEALCTELQQKTGAQMAIVTVHSFDGQSLENYAADLYKQLGVGSKQDSRGVLLLLSPDERKYRIEVGYGLEPVINDARAGDAGRAMVPSLRQGDYSAAIEIVAWKLAKYVADESGVTMSGQPPARAVEVHQDPSFSILKWIFLIIFILVWINGFRGALPLLLGGLGSAGRGRYRGGWGGSGWSGGGWGGGGFGGGSGGGGFGGFGGGSSGGGGASGSW
jgi:uncharacterized protein